MENHQGNVGQYQTPGGMSTSVVVRPGKNVVSISNLGGAGAWQQ